MGQELDVELEGESEDEVEWEEWIYGDDRTYGSLGEDYPRRGICE